MDGRRAKRWLFGFVTALLLTAAACGGGGGQPTGGGSEAPPSESEATGEFSPQETVVAATDISDAVTLDPQVAFEFSSVGADVLLYQRLVQFPIGDMTQVVGDAASSWDVSDDGLHWTFHLKHGQKFSSGNELTSADVVYTFQRVVHIENDPASWLITQMGITKDNVDQVVTAPDPYTVQIDLPQPFSPGAFLAVLANPVAGIVDSQTVKAHESNGDWGSGWLFDHSAGSGPYVLKQWTKDDRMEFVPNPEYAGQAPSIKHVVWLNVPESATRLDMLKAGSADIAEGLSFAQVESVQNDPSFKVFKQPDQSMVYLGMGVNTVPAFQKKEVRQAVKYAIDYQGIVDQLLHGFAEPLQGIIPKGVFGYTDKVFFQRDVEKAKSLMKAAGYGDGFTVEMLVPVGTVAGGVPAASLANVLKSNLADIGITANIRQLESGELYTRYRGHEAQLVLAQWGMDYPDPQDFAGPFAEYSQQSLIWRLQDNDPELEALGNQAATLQNTPERQALYDQLNELEAEQGPFAIMYQPDVVFVYRADLGNFQWDHVNGIGYWVMTKQ